MSDRYSSCSRLKSRPSLSSQRGLTSRHIRTTCLLFLPTSIENAPFTYGNAGRNILVGPHRINLDAAAHKTFRFSERVTAQLRLESFNATNTAPLGNPNTQVGNQQFGVISSAGTQRNNQIGLKILF